MTKDATIVRVWRASATKDNAAGYLQHAATRVFPGLRRLPGHRGALVLTRQQGANHDIQVLTFWDSMEAIQAFAGPAADVAVVEPEAQAILIDYDRRVAHHNLAIGQLHGLAIAPVEPDGDAYTLRPHRPGDMGWITHR